MKNIQLLYSTNKNLNIFNLDKKNNETKNIKYQISKKTIINCIKMKENNY